MSRIPRWFEIERDAYRLAEYERARARELFGDDETAAEDYLSDLGYDAGEIALNRRRVIALDDPEIDPARLATAEGERARVETEAGGD
jgi:hypothetical protein